MEPDTYGSGNDFEIKPKTLAHIVLSCLKNNGEKLKLGSPLELKGGAFYLGEQILMPHELSKKITLIVLKTLNAPRSKWESVLAQVTPLIEQSAAKGLGVLEEKSQQPSFQVPQTGGFLFQPEFCGILPPRLEAFICARAKSLGTLPDGIVGSVLACCCAALPSGFKLRIGDDYEEHATLWIGVVGKSSTKKTPVLKSGLSFFQRKQAEFEEHNRRTFAEYKKELDKYKSEIAKSNKKGQNLTSLPIEPDKPRQKAILETDATIEALLLSCADNPRGVLYFRDEMSAWLAQITRRDAEKERATWLEGYNASPYSQTRIGRGRISISCYRTIIYGGLQPKIVQKLLSDELVDGLAARFILLRNDNIPGAIPTNGVPTELSDYLNVLLARLFDATACSVPMDSEGLRAHAAHCTAYTRELEALPDSHWRAFLGKRPGLLARITLLLAALDAADLGLDLSRLPPVGKNTVDRAARFVELFIQRSAAIIYQEAGVDVSQSGGVFFNDKEKMVISWLQKHYAKFKDVFTSREIYTGCRAFQDLRRAKQDALFIEALCASSLAVVEPHGMRGFLLTVSPYIEEWKPCL